MTWETDSNLPELKGKLAPALEGTSLDEAREAFQLFYDAIVFGSVISGRGFDSLLELFNTPSFLRKGLLSDLLLNIETDFEILDNFQKMLLFKALTNGFGEFDESARLGAVQILSKKFFSDESVSWFLKLANASEVAMRGWALEGLGNISAHATGDLRKAIKNVVSKLVNDENSGVRSLAQRILTRLGSDRVPTSGT